MFNNEENLKYRILKKKYKENKKKNRSIKINTFTKIIVFIIIIVSLIDLQFSYILAFLDRGTIAEELSKQICITIIGTSIIYMIRAFFDTKAEHKEKLTREIIDRKFNDYTDEIINDSGIDTSDIDSISNLNENDIINTDDDI